MIFWICYHELRDELCTFDRSKVLRTYRKQVLHLFRSKYFASVRILSLEAEIQQAKHINNKFQSNANDHVPAN
jgi:hypothetical protein